MIHGPFSSTYISPLPASTFGEEGIPTEDMAPGGLHGGRKGLGGGCGGGGLVL